MRVIRYEDERGVIRLGALQADGSALRITGDIFGAHAVTREPAAVRKLLAPVVPTNVLCIGRNYRRRGPESDSAPPEYPIVFMKATTAVQDPGVPILLPRRLRSDEVTHEGELAVVVGKRCKNVPAAGALDYVLGYTCAIDVTARDWQDRWGGGQWWRGKSFDTFSPLGPWLVLADELQDPAGLRVRTMLNAMVTHDGSTTDMIFDVPTLIAFLSGDTTLTPGTVILTGAPPRTEVVGKSPILLKPGDVVTVDIEGIGRLTNPVAEGT